jgi:hypothetical protein
MMFQVGLLITIDHLGLVTLIQTIPIALQAVSSIYVKGASSVLTGKMLIGLTTMNLIILLTMLFSTLLMVMASLNV